MSVFKRSYEEIKNYETMRNMVNDKLKNKFLQKSIDTNEVCLKTPTITYRDAELWGGVESPYEWGNDKYFFDGWRLIDVMEYLQEEDINFIRLLKRPNRLQMILINCGDETTIVWVDSHGMCVSGCETYTLHIQDAFNELF